MRRLPRKRRTRSSMLTRPSPRARLASVALKPQPLSQFDNVSEEEDASQVASTIRATGLSDVLRCNQ
jgi:hypothetical protein